MNYDCWKCGVFVDKDDLYGVIWDYGRALPGKARRLCLTCAQNTAFAFSLNGIHCNEGTKTGCETCIKLKEEYLQI